MNIYQKQPRGWKCKLLFPKKEKNTLGSSGNISASRFTTIIVKYNFDIHREQLSDTIFRVIDSLFIMLTFYPNIRCLLSSARRFSRQFIANPFSFLGFRTSNLSQTTIFRLFQTQRVCRRLFQLWWKWQKNLQTGRKHRGKRRNCSLRAISPFPKVFSKDLCCIRKKKPELIWKRLNLYYTTPSLDDPENPRNFWKQCGEMLLTGILSFFAIAFYPSKYTSYRMSPFYFVVCKCSECGQV